MPGRRCFVVVRLHGTPDDKADLVKAEIDQFRLQILKILINLFLNQRFYIISQDMNCYYVLEKAGTYTALDAADFIVVEDLTNSGMIFDDFYYLSVPYIIMKFHCICSFGNFGSSLHGIAKD